MSMINISNLSFTYEGSSEAVFENVNLRLDTDWKLGFVGRNGRGKTTLLKLLSGELKGGGSITASVRFDYFPYTIEDTEMTMLEIIRSIAPEVEEWEIYRELSLLDIESDIVYQPFNTLSGGERAKAMLAGLFLRRDAFLLIDEPTNHLDSEGRRLLGNYLRKKSGFILVSHDRRLLDACTNHTLSINRCDIELQKGSYSDWEKNKAMRDSFEREQNEKLKRDIARLSEAAERSSRWADKTEKGKFNTTNSGLDVDRGYVGHKSAKMMKRSKAIEARRIAAAEEKSTLLRNIERTAQLKLTPLRYHSKRFAELKGVTLKYGGKTVCKNVSFTINQGERTALCGKNGSGKSSVLKLILGENIDYTGELYIGGGLKISYVPQTTGHLSGSLYDYAKRLGADTGLFFAILRKLDFSREHFEQTIESFSEGQKKKVLIAGSLCENAHLYIWDEPLNYIDIISRLQIEELIKESEATMIFVEHDEVFRDKTADNIVLI